MARRRCLARWFAGGSRSTRGYLLRTGMARTYAVADPRSGAARCDRLRRGAQLFATRAAPTATAPAPRQAVFDDGPLIRVWRANITRGGHCASTPPDRGGIRHGVAQTAGQWCSCLRSFHEMGDEDSPPSFAHLQSRPLATCAGGKCGARRILYLFGKFRCCKPRNSTFAAGAGPPAMADTAGTARSGPGLPGCMAPDSPASMSRARRRRFKDAANIRPREASARGRSGFCARSARKRRTQTDRRFQP